jgi:tripartite-type tricarboxylate transporter receptor subunit TctC
VVLSHIRAGKLKALAITSLKRAAALPEVPTTGETGYPKVLSDNWYGLIGPLGIAPAIRKRIHAAAVAALNAPEVMEPYAKVSGVPMPSSPEEFAVFLAQDQAKWGAVVKAIGFKAD